MTVALARRLVWDDVITQDDASRALHAHVTRRVAFLAALLEVAPGAESRLEQELAHGPVDRGVPVVPDLSLCALLPPGLCGALLAVPVSRDERTGVVRVVAADPADGHLAAELPYHLRGPIEVRHGPLRAVLAAARGVERPAPGVRPSDAPIPLVRITDPSPAPHTVKGVAPQAIVSAVSRFPVVVPPRPNAVLTEPVIQLTRTKSIAPPAPVAPPAPAAPPPAPAESARVKGTLPGAPAPPSAVPAPPSDDVAFDEMERAASPDDVAAVLARGLSSVARRVVVLAVRARSFEGREASDAGDRPRIRSLAVAADRPSVLLTASQSGSYVGPLPRTPVHEELAEFLGRPEGEILAGAVMVSWRAALVVVAAGLDTAYLASRRAQKLAEAAGRAIERIVRERKR